MSDRAQPTPPKGGLARLWAAPRTAHVLLFVAPVMFNANILTARATADFIPPVALAFWRWTVVFLILLAFVGPRLWVRRRAIAREWKDLLSLHFPPGDLWIVGATAAWAVYAVLLRYRPSEMGPMTRFAAIVLFGVVVLLPFHLWELAAGAVPVPDGRTVTAVLTVAVIAGFGAYQVYGRVQETLGAARAGLILYLSPVFNSLLAFLLLGEQLRVFHFAGAVLILTGIYLATARQQKTKS